MKNDKNLHALRSIVAALIAAIFPFAGLAQDVSAPVAREQLSSPTEIVSYPSAFVVGEALPKWSQGYLIAYRRDTAPSDTEANLRVFDRKGTLVTQTRLWFQGASLLRVKDIAVSRDGRLGVVGIAIDASGSLAGFLADITLSTEPRAKIIQTSPFEGQSVAYAPDGTIWMLGYQVGPSRLLSNDEPDHFIVEHLASDGVLKGEHLKRSSLHCAENPAATSHGGFPRILTSEDRIGLFLPACDSWVELKPSGDVIGRWQWSNNNQNREVVTVAMTAGNNVYARVESPQIGLFRLDKENSDWVPVNTDAARLAGAPFGWLQGSDGDKLVYHTKARLVWAKPSSQSN